MSHNAFSGNWASRFVSPSGNVHDFELAVNIANAVPVAHLKMKQTKSGDSEPSLSVNYITQASATGRFMGLLSTDPVGLGLNCMTLKLSENGEAIRHDR